MWKRFGPAAGAKISFLEHLEAPLSILDAAKSIDATRSNRMAIFRSNGAIFDSKFLFLKNENAQAHEGVTVSGPAR